MVVQCLAWLAQIRLDAIVLLLQIRNDGEILWAFDSATRINLEVPLLRFDVPENLATTAGWT